MVPGHLKTCTRARWCIFLSAVAADYDNARLLAGNYGGAGTDSASEGECDGWRISRRETPEKQGWWRSRMSHTSSPTWPVGWNAPSNRHPNSIFHLPFSLALPPPLFRPSIDSTLISRHFCPSRIFLRLSAIEIIFQSPVASPVCFGMPCFAAVGVNVKLTFRI
ncbi:hypothetical protein PUN28_017476 [Cardiocondyla obscurior]|uniref:Secreted protein n=1 Tax=Cardiocondyla obscurior TaxID=286306 RepID=A0AAW2ELQ2_9HYME